MNCPSCKKNISEDASFCQHCGASIKQERLVEEFITFVRKRPPGKGGSYSLKDGTEFAARAFFWGHAQEEIHTWLAALAPQFVPISEVGPGAVKLRYHNGGLFGDDWVEESEIRITLRVTLKESKSLDKKAMNEIFKEINKKGAVIYEVQ